MTRSARPPNALRPASRWMLVVSACSALSLSLVGCLDRRPPALEASPRPSMTALPGARATEGAGPATNSGGWLATIGADGNVYAVSLGDAGTVQLTDDATAPPEGQGRSYHRISWSPDGQLACAAVTRSPEAVRSELYVRSSLHETARLVARNDGHFVIYIYWSPKPCLSQPSCRQLAYLIEETDGVGLHLVRLDGRGVQDDLLAVGRPFYFAWSPDGQQILWHTGRARAENPDAEIGLYDLPKRRRERLPVAPGAFPAPAWSPTGEHWLAVSAADGVNRLELRGGHEPVVVAAHAGGEMAFAWAPDGQKVAYALRDAPEAPFYGPVRLFDVATGRDRQLTSDAFDILALFWAPDGERIGYLTRLNLPNVAWMQWRVYDLVGEQDRGFAAFRPSPLMEFAVHSFNQYAQSHPFWSPDGRFLVYAERDRTLRDRVWLVDTKAGKGSHPIPAGEGSFGVFSWGPPAADADEWDWPGQRTGRTYRSDYNMTMSRYEPAGLLAR